MICGADEAASNCDAPDCVTLMTAPEVYAWTTIDGAVARVCSEPCLQALSAAEYKRNLCEHCGDPTSADDRVPTAAGGRAHATCAARLSNALGVERLGALGRGVVAGGGRTVQIVRRTGPAFRTIRGGRS